MVPLIVVGLVDGIRAVLKQGSRSPDADHIEHIEKLAEYRLRTEGELR